LSDRKKVLPQLSPHCGIQEEIMARKGSRPEVSRRKFLAGAAVAGCRGIDERCQGGDTRDDGC